MWSRRLSHPKVAALVIPASSLSRKVLDVHCQDSAKRAPCPPPSWEAISGSRLRRLTKSWRELGNASLLASRPVGDYSLLVNDICVHHIALLINDVVDLIGFNEEEQQDIFVTAIILLLDEIAGVLPKSYVDMVRGDRKYHHVFVRKDVEFFETRLIEFARHKVRLPFLGESDEKLVVQCVVHILVTAMVEQKGIEHTLKHHQKTIIVEVFMKSMVGHFVDPEERKKYVGHIVDHVKELPFVPSPVIARIVTKTFELVGEVIEASLKETLDEVLRIHGHRHAGVTREEMAMRESFLEVVPVLKGLDTEQRAKLAEAMTVRTCKVDEYIIRRGEIGNEFFIVQEGGAKAVIDGKIATQYGPGSYFGERSVLHPAQLRGADVLATTDVRLLCLGHDEFQQLMVPAHSLLEQLPPAEYPQSEFVGHLRLHLYSSLISKISPVLCCFFSKRILALVDEILLQVQDEKVDRALNVLIASGEFPVQY